MVSMSITAPALDGIGARSSQASKAPERERMHHKWSPLTLHGRFMRENRQEHSCRLKDISCIGAAIVTPITVEPGEPGERIVAYFDQVRGLEVSISGASVETEARPEVGSKVVLGQLRATVVRHLAEGLGLEFIDIQNPDAPRRSFR